MGIVAGKPVYSVGEFTFHGSQIQSNPEKTTLIYKPGPLDFRQNTLVSKTSHDFRSPQSECLQLEASTPTVWRVGLTTVDPVKNENFMQQSVFDIEDGTDEMDRKRNLFITEYDELYFGKPDNKVAYQLDLQTNHLWIYIVVIYGKPTLKASFIELNERTSDGSTDKTKVEVVSLKTNETVDDSANILSSNTVICRMKEPFSQNLTHYLKWQMDNDTQKDWNNYQTHGLICLRLVAEQQGKDTSTQGDGQNQDIIIWSVSSAIKTYPYSGKIAFRGNFDIGNIEHNVTPVSVEETLTKPFNYQPDSDLELKLEIEFSPGELSIEKCVQGQVKQIPGTLCIVTLERSGYDADELKKQVQGLIHKKPARIQYGMNPMKFLAEFSERLTSSDVAMLRQSTHVKNLQHVTETQLVQVLGAPEAVDEDALRSHFSRHQVGGGDLEIEKVAKIPGCWKLKFNSKDVARKVWIRGTHVVDGEEVCVLPFYEGLGYAVLSPKNGYGGRPEFDRSELVITDLDNDKLRFVKGNSVTKEHLETHIKQQLNVFPNWENSAEDTICFVCRVEEKHFETLLIWKDLTMESVQNYFKYTIKCVECEVAIPDWNAACEYALKNQDEHRLLVCIYEGSKKIRLIGLDSKQIGSVAERIGVTAHNREFVTKPLKVTFEQYKAFENAGKIDALQKEFPEISFRLMIKEEVITVTGQESDVNEVIRILLRACIEVQLVTVDLTSDHEKFLLTRHGIEFLRSELKERRLPVDIKLQAGKLSYLEAGSQSRANEVSDLISKTIITETVLIPVEVSSCLQSTSLQRFGESVDERLVIINRVSDNSINLTGAVKDVSRSKVAVLKYLKEEADGQITVRIPISIAEYLNKYNNIEYSHDCEFHKGKAKDITGKVIITGKPNQLKETKKRLLKDSTSVKMRWIMISKPWLASVVQDISGLKEVARKRCYIQAEIGQTLAVNNIQSIAIHDKNGSTIQVKVGLITHNVTDAIVNSCGSNLEFEHGIAKQFIRTGSKHGMVIQEECRNIVREKGEIPVGGFTMTSPGFLRCINIIHVVEPKYIDGKSGEETAMKKTVTSVLEQCSSMGFTSVVMPAFGCALSSGYPDGIGTRCIVQAVAEYLDKSGSSSLKEVYLSADCMKIATLFTDALVKLPNPWIGFQHNKKLYSEDTLQQDNPRPTSARPKSSRTITRVPVVRFADEEAGVLWGSNPIRLNFGESDDEDDTELKKKDMRKTLAKSTQRRPHLTGECFKDGLPYKIPMSPSLHLHVIKGDLTKQKVDVIVNTVFPKRHGAITQSILVSGGQSLKSEFNTLGEMQHGIVYETGGGQLKCKRVYHVLVPSKWESKQTVYTIVMSCLNKADTDGNSSIALPVFGTGKSDFPIDDIVDAMANAMCTFANRQNTSSMANIYIVLYAQDDITCKIFEEEIPCLVVPYEPFNIISLQTDIQTESYQPKRAAAYVHPSTTEAHTDADDVAIFKVMAMKDVDDIRKSIEKIVDEQIITKTYDFKELKELSNKEEKILKPLEKKYAVSVEVDSKKMCVKVHGLCEWVEKCGTEVLRYLHADFPIWRDKLILQDKLYNSIQWFYDDNGTMTVHDKASNLKIHMGFAKGNDFDYHNELDGKDYRVAVSSQTEYEKSNTNVSRRLYQRNSQNEGHDEPIPVDWEIADGKSDVVQKELPPTHKIFNDVKTELIKAGCKPTSIQKIFRLEHRYMWKMYHAKKYQLGQQNPGHQNEMQLWHGTDSNTYQKIIANGFDRNFCGKNAVAWGEGAYFAVRSAYSHRYALPANDGTRRIFRCRVLTGMPTQGAQGMKYLPERSRINNIPVCFDSATDNNKPPNIYVIFNDAQAYPEYMIEYKG